MSVIIKSFMGVFFFLLVIFSGVGIVGYQMQVNSAAGFKQDVIEELQNSNFAPSVVNACILEGERSQYEVSIDISSSDGTRATYTKDCPAADTSDVAAAYVTVRCKSRFPLLGLETSNQFRGFAR